MAGFEVAPCGCVYDSSPAGWLYGCDLHEGNFEWYKWCRSANYSLTEAWLRGDRSTPPPTRENIEAEALRRLNERGIPDPREQGREGTP